MADNQPGIDWIRVAQSYKDGMAESRRLASAHRNSDSTRLVWYVAICGYVLLNGVKFVQDVLPVVTPGRIAALLIPWAVTAIVSIVAHIVISRAGWQEDRYHLGVIGSLDVFEFKTASGQTETDGSALLSIIKDTDPKLKPAREAMDSANRWGRRLVQTAHVSLLSSFLWSTVSVVFSQLCGPKREFCSRCARYSSRGV